MKRRRRERQEMKSRGGEEDAKKSVEWSSKGPLRVIRVQIRSGTLSGEAN